jgi:amino acid transporter
VLGARVAVKRVLLGRPQGSRQLRHELLPKRVALPVFGSDLVSSAAYATQEMLLVLVLAGAAALWLVSPLSVAVAGLLVVVVASYRQVVRAYPHGGGAYIAAKDNLGDGPALVAAAALLIGYPLTVAVAVAAAVAAVLSAYPELVGQQVLLALGLIAAVTLVNLRGVREAGVVTALATYGFVVLLAVLVVTGIVRCGFGLGGCPEAASAGTTPPAAEALTLLVVLRAFAIGAVALGGIEATSNSVTAFRYPQSRNASATLALAGALTAALFVGVSYLAAATGVVPREGMQRTVLSEVARAVLGEGIGLALVQAATVAVLLIAAHTSFADFPRFASVLARDRWLPRQFLARGDRFLFSNGILLLAVVSGLLLAVYDASISGLVPLYVVAVFIAFTLSLAGMARRCLRLREPAWKGWTTLHAAGAVVCGAVFAVAAATTFLAGAWVVIAAVPLLMALLARVNRHYRDVGMRLRAGVALRQEPRPNHAVILLDRVDEAAARALSYVLSTGATSVRALGVPLPGTDLQARWATLAPDVPLRMLQPAKDPGTADALVRALDEEADRNGRDAFTTAVIPETLSRSWVDQLREHRLALRLKAKLHHAGRVVVSDVTSPVGGPGPYTVEEPAEHHVIVLVNAVDAATVRALAYAEGLHASTLRALAVSLDPERSTRLLTEWDDWGVSTPIEIIDSPFRSLAATVRGYMRDFTPDGRHTIVTCVLPTFVLEHRLQAALHNQSAMLIRSTLLFERGVVSTSVPYPLSAAAEEPTVEARDAPRGA